MDASISNDEMYLKNSKRFLCYHLAVNMLTHIIELQETELDSRKSRLFSSMSFSNLTQNLFAQYKIHEYFLKTS